jgi:acylphosphatase
MAERIARDLVVHGRVQGVFYRAFVAAEAARRGVAGRAVNRASGTVAVHLEGDADAVAAVVAACRVGSERARVERVDEHDSADEGLSGFDTR